MDWKIVINNYFFYILTKICSNAENQAIIEISIDCKLLENDCDLIIYSNTMQKCIYEKLSQNIIPIYLYAIIDNQINQKVGREVLFERVPLTIEIFFFL